MPFFANITEKRLAINVRTTPHNNTGSFEMSKPPRAAGITTEARNTSAALLDSVESAECCDFVNLLIFSVVNNLLFVFEDGVEFALFDIFGDFFRGESTRVHANVYSRV